MLPLTYGQRRDLRKAAPGSAGEKLLALAQRSMDIGESPSLSYAFNAIRLRNPELFQEYLRETGEYPDVDDKEPSVTTADTLLAKARAMVDAGASPDLTQALEQVAKADPHGYRQYRQEASQRTPAARDEAPYAPLVVTKTRAHEEYDTLVADERSKHPELSEAEIHMRVLHSPAMGRIMEKNRVDFFARARG